jgi:hypothetical protein
MRSSRTIGYAAALTSLVLGVGSLSGCGIATPGDSSPGRTIDAAPIPTSPEAAALVAAVAATRAAGTARVTTSLLEDQGDSADTTTTTGLQALDGSRAEVTARLPQGVLDSTVVYDVPIVVVGPTVWFSFPAPSLPAKRQWGTAATDWARTHNDETLPAVWRIPEWLTSLEHATDVTDQGVPPEGFTGARMFTATMPREADTLAASLGHGTFTPPDGSYDEVSVSVVIDDRGRIIHIGESWEATTSAGVPLLATVDVGLDRFGTAVDPQAPTAPTSAGNPHQMFATAGIP